MTTIRFTCCCQLVFEQKTDSAETEARTFRAGETLEVAAIEPETDSDVEGYVSLWLPRETGWVARGVLEKETFEVVKTS
jgi:hypothetical protein